MSARNEGAAGSPAAPSALYWQFRGAGNSNAFFREGHDFATLVEAIADAFFREGYDFATLVEAIADAIAEARARAESDASAPIGASFVLYANVEPAGAPQPDGNHPKVAPAAVRPGERTS